MTACVNKNHGRRVAGVVTASLVGALTLGGVSLAAVPTVALAEQGADAQFVKPGSELANASYNAIWFGKSTDYTDGSNKPVTDGKVPTYRSAVVGRSLTDVWVNASDGTLVEAMTGGRVDSDYQVAVYKAGEDGAKTGSALAGNKVVESGSYVLEVVAVDGDYAGQTFSWRFDVAGKEFGTVAQYGYTYFTGAELSASFSSDGSKLKSSDYTVSYTQNGKEAKVLHAGTYTATLTGQGQYAGSSATATVEVKPFVLNNDTKVTVDPFTGAAPTHASSITAEFDTGVKVDSGTAVYATYSLDPSVLGLSWFGAPATPGGTKPSVTVSEVGTYYAKVADQRGNLNVSDEYKDDVTGTAPLSTKTAKVKDMASFRYLGKDLADLTFDKSQGQAFTASSLSAYLGSKKLSKTSPVAYEVVNGTKADGRTPTASGDFELGVPGTYVVRVAFPSVDQPWDSTDYTYAASQTIKVTYTQGALDADQYVTVKYDRKIVDSVTKAYDGKPVKDTDFTVTAKDADGEPVAVKATLYGEDGKAVEGNQVTDAGKYTLKVEATDGHTLTGTTELPVTINKVDLSSAKVGKLQKWNDATQSGEEYVALNGAAKFNTYDAVKAALAPVYQTGVEASDAEGADDPLNGAFKGTDNKGLDFVPENVATKVEFNDGGTWKQVNDFSKGAGEYRLTLSVASDVAKNYVLPEGAESVVLNFKAVTDNSFSDVQPSDWYYKYVNAAADKGFMNGDRDVNGHETGNFRPESALTRAEAVTVLYNMSGQDGNENGGQNNNNHGYVTGFDDVASSHWAAKYVAWAKRSGVVNGYDGTNDFRPDQTVTRNEFAKMLFNYAKNVAKDATTGNVDTSALKFSDGVDGWAQEAVAWAVSTPSKFEGETDSTVVSGYPQDNTFRGGNNVLRAEVAKMAVSYQTKALR